jgi:hypothetical protein
MSDEKYISITTGCASSARNVTLLSGEHRKTYAWGINIKAGMKVRVAQLSHGACNDGSRTWFYREQIIGSFTA